MYDPISPFKIDQHLARQFEFYGACLSSPPLPFLMQSKNYPFFKFNDLNQSENKVVIVESLYPYSSSSVEFLLVQSAKIRNNYGAFKLFQYCDMLP